MYAVTFKKPAKRSRLEAFDVMFLIKMFHFRLDWRVRPRSLWYSTRSSSVPSILRTGGGSRAWEKLIISSLHLLGFSRISLLDAQEFTLSSTDWLSALLLS